MKGNKKILFSKPVLREKRIEERWYIYCVATLPGGVKHKIKVYAGINRGTTIEARKRLADTILSGWDPEKYFRWDKPQSIPVVNKNEKLILLINQFYNDQLDWKIRTRQTYRTILNVFYRWLRNNSLNNIMPANFSTDNAREFMREQVSVYHVSNSTFNARKAFLYSVWDHWRIYCRHFKIIQNPFEAIRSLPESKTPKKIFTVEDRTLIKNYVSKHHPDLMLFIEYAYYTFLRPPAEIRALQVGDHDFDKWTITVSSKKSKTNKRRKHAVPTVFQTSIAHFQQMNSDFFVFGAGGKPGKFPMAKNRMIELHRRVMDHLGFSSDYSLYSWRHTAACEMYLEKQDIRLVQQAMQHSSIATTEKYLRNLGALDDPRLYERHSI